MTAKQKAKELYAKYIKYCNELSHDKNKTLCKLIILDVVDEIISAIDSLQYTRKTDFWELVKEEINKI